jgi:Ca2+-binding EF-hand superfamily protein
LLKYYKSLDDDDSGSIGVDELEEPLIALGLLDSRQQVQDIVNEVDDDGSGMLEFEEFLKIIKGGQGGGGGGGDEADDGGGAGAIYKFF